MHPVEGSAQPEGSCGVAQVLNKASTGRRATHPYFRTNTPVSVDWPSADALSAPWNRAASRLPLRLQACARRMTTCPARMQTCTARRKRFLSDPQRLPEQTKRAPQDCKSLFQLCKPSNEECKALPQRTKPLPHDHKLVRWNANCCGRRANFFSSRANLHCRNANLVRNEANLHCSVANFARTGASHCCSGNNRQHPRNGRGDPIAKRTVKQPGGRPCTTDAASKPHNCGSALAIGISSSAT
jgi:hypothetical protein